MGLDLWLDGRSRRFRPTTTCRMRMNSVLGGGLEVTGLKTSHYLLNKFGARRRQGSVRRWGGLWAGGAGPRWGGANSLTPEGVSYSGGLRLG